MVRSGSSQTPKEYTQALPAKQVSTKHKQKQTSKEPGERKELRRDVHAAENKVKHTAATVNTRNTGKAHGLDMMFRKQRRIWRPRTLKTAISATTHTDCVHEHADGAVNQKKQR